MPRIIRYTPKPRAKPKPGTKPALTTRIVRHGKFWAPAEVAPPVGTKDGEGVWLELMRRVRENSD